MRWESRRTRPMSHCSEVPQTTTEGPTTNPQRAGRWTFMGDGGDGNSMGLNLVYLAALRFRHKHGLLPDAEGGPATPPRRGASIAMVPDVVCLCLVPCSPRIIQTQQRNHDAVGNLRCASSLGSVDLWQRIANRPQRRRSWSPNSTTSSSPIAILASSRPSRPNSCSPSSC